MAGDSLFQAVRRWDLSRSRSAAGRAPRVARALGLSSVPDYTTLYRFLQRLGDGTPNEAILSLEKAAAFAGQVVTAQPLVQPADAEKPRLLVESALIRLAYAHDWQFAVSLSGTRTLRFLFVDDPGAGKTIMAGLLLKEMKLRDR